MILDRLETRAYGPADDFWYRPIWASVSDNTSASPEQALGVSAWFNGIAIIAGTIGSLPLKLYRRDGDAREEVRDDPRHWMMYRQPNQWQTAFELREMAQGHVLTRGNFYARIMRDRMGRAAELMPLHPDRMKVETEAGRIVYKLMTQGGDVRIPTEDVLHVRGVGGDGITGWSVVALARKSLGYSLGLEQHGSELMGNKARPGGILGTDQVLTKEQKQALAEAWDTMYSGGGIGRTAVVDAGLTWQSIGLTAEDAQFLESRKFQITEVSRWLNLPPHYLKDLERSTYSNIEQQSLEFVTHTIRPWIERWEQRLDMALLDEEERESLFFKFNVEALMRGDQESRANFYRSLFDMGALSPNDIRSKEDMNPVEGGDQRFVQLNLVPLDQARLSTMVGTGAERAEERALPEPEVRTVEVRSTARMRLRLRSAHRELMREAAERLVRREVQDLRRLLEAVDEGNVAEFIRRLERWADSLPNVARRVMGPQIETYINLVAELAADEVEIDDFTTERIADFRESYLDTFARGHSTQTVRRLRGTMEDAEGDPWENAGAMLTRWENNRADEISLREAVTGGAAVAAMVYGLVGRGVVWRTTGQENCPYCDLMAGRSVRVGEKFLTAGDSLEPEGQKPLTVGRDIGHPSAHSGCDCYVEPA